MTHLRRVLFSLIFFFYPSAFVTCSVIYGTIAYVKFLKMQELCCRLCKKFSIIGPRLRRTSMLPANSRFFSTFTANKFICIAGLLVMFEIFTMFFLQGQELDVNVTDNDFLRADFTSFRILLRIAAKRQNSLLRSISDKVCF